MSRHVTLALTLFALSCQGRDRGDRADTHADVATAVQEERWSAAPMAPEPSPAPGQALKGAAVTGGRRDAMVRSKAAKVADKAFRGVVADEDAAGEAEATKTRAWFPESFLFSPLVVTDAEGRASVSVRVPDRLTTWRVLALAHTRTGQQGGATASFLGTLPSYVDPIVPPFLMAGDSVRLPIQLINTTEQPVSGTLETIVEGAAARGGNGARTIPAQGSLVEYAELVATRPGTARVGIKLAGTDAVVRTIDVLPTGEPVDVTRAGTLAAPRSFAITAPPGTDPTTSRVRLLVFPGALAVLRSELSLATARTGVAEDAYALLIAGQAPALLAGLGDRPDASRVEALRALGITASQRAIRHGRTLDVTRATALAEAALAHPSNPVLARLGERAQHYLAQQQRPDGTFSGETGWTLQRVLVTTADATRASADRNVRARAAGAFARTAEQVTDAYTAAAILASGAVTGELAETLRARILAALVPGADGAKRLEVPAHVVRADGTAPSTAEATALAVLALAGGDPAVLAELGTTLLGSYVPAVGWGDGTANLACLRAVLELFRAPLPSHVKITLARDGAPVATGDFDAAQLRDVISLAAPAGDGEHRWSITAEPALPGLGYSFELRSYVPWQTRDVPRGLELALAPAIEAVVGRPTEIALTAVAPSQRPIAITHALPAGVAPDRPSLEALVAAGTVTRFAVADGKVELVLAPLRPGQTFSASYKVIPTLAGTLHTGASQIAAGDTRFHVPPVTWTIR